MASLETYRSKRNFRKTSEPSGSARASSKDPSAKKAGGLYVIQKHDATRLHYDFRLEHDGVLWSWAVTRGPSLDPSEKRLAVHVEDHPIDYGDFEGTIPKGEYGGGSVIVWDNGEWLPDGDPAAGMKKGHIDFELKGNKLNGHWHLVRLKPRPGEKRDNWLLIKAKDEFARSRGDILEEAPQSVKSGLTIDHVGEQADGAVWHSKPRSKKTISAKMAPPSGKAQKVPDFVPPCLATLQRLPPSDDGWLHEVKFDGYRTEARIDSGEITLLTRKGLDWTERFGDAIPAALERLDCRNAILDGEIVVLAENGSSSFSALQAALSDGRTEKLAYYVFDLVFLDGADLSNEPLLDRKERLRDLLAPLGEGSPVRYSEHFVEPGNVMLQHACRLGLEGVVSKRADSSYHSGRGHDWIKSKCTQRQEFVIAGYLPSDKSGRSLRNIVVAYNEGGELKSAGHVGTGFSASSAADLKKKLDRLKQKAAPISGPAAREKGVIWVKPELVAEIEFGSWTSERILRHASFQGLREDKPAEDVTAELPEDGTPRKKAGPAQTEPSAKKPSSKTETSVTLSHSEKLLWPGAKISKQDLLDYYASVWPLMEKFVVNRPLALVRAPDGVGGQRFFQKHASPGMHAAISRRRDPKDGEELLFIRDFDGLAALVQLGVVEVHIWGSTIEALETPDQIIFDLDPDEGLAIEDVQKATLTIRGRLEELGMPSFVKTSGGKGFHVAVPLKPKADWDRVKAFAHDFAKAMEQAEPDRYTAILSKSARKGRIFIDYLRNGRGSTTVVAYSSRGNPDGTMSMPIEWDMVAKTVPAAFRIGEPTARKKVEKLDSWQDFFKQGFLLR